MTRPATPTKRDLLALFSNSNAAVSAFVVLLGFIGGTLLVVLVGKNPLDMFSAILQVVSGWDSSRQVWNIRYVGEWLAIAMPLILCGLSMGFAARSGLFNIGAEGQYIVGLTIAQFVALMFPQIPYVHWLLALVLATAGAALWGGLVGWLKARYAVSEVVATIMLNYVAFFASRYLTQLLPGTNTYRTPDFPPTAQLDNAFLAQLTNGSTLNAGLVFVIVAVIVYWFVIEKTRLGFSLRATGLAKEAARCSGINVTRSAVVSMAIAGAFAGLAGAIVALGSFDYGRVVAGYDNYGFNGIAVALVGNSTGPGIAISGLLFGMISAAQPLMQSRQIPREIGTMIFGLIVVFISLRAGVKMLVDWRRRLAAARGESDDE